VEVYHRKRVTLEFDEVTVTLGKKDIIRSVYGAALPGQMLAILGASGTITHSIALTSSPSSS